VLRDGQIVDQFDTRSMDAPALAERYQMKVNV
jgi:hypothetical protein